MATGIVSAALRLAGQATAAAWLLALAAAGFCGLVVRRGVVTRRIFV